jgi:hypothetical protein
MTITTYYFGAAYWAGGSGNLSDNWIIGETYNSDTDSYIWKYGVPGSGELLLFVPTAPLGDASEPLGGGGTLSGGGPLEE